jgi:hypothetical protein
MKTTFRSIVLALGLFITTAAVAQKKAEKNKFLENRKFDVQFYEIKTNGRGKALKTLLMLKGGKVEADLMYEKLTLPPIVYRVTLDSTYTEDDTPMHMVTFEATYSEDKNEYTWEVTVTNYDIEGTVVQMKSGVEKKRYEFSGSEKPKKK